MTDGERMQPDFAASGHVEIPDTVADIFDNYRRVGNLSDEQIEANAWQTSFAKILGSLVDPDELALRTELVGELVPGMSFVYQDRVAYNFTENGQHRVMAGVTFEEGVEFFRFHGVVSNDEYAAIQHEVAVRHAGLGICPEVGNYLEGITGTGEFYDNAHAMIGQASDTQLAGLQAEAALGLAMGIEHQSITHSFVAHRQYEAINAEVGDRAERAGRLLVVERLSDEVLAERVAARPLDLVWVEAAKKETFSTPIQVLLMPDINVPPLVRERARQSERLSSLIGRVLELSMPQVV